MTERHGAGFIERERRNGGVRHGTSSGARRHALAGEDPCDACRADKAEYDRLRLAAPEKALRNRLHARAQSKAYGVLAKVHREEYRRLYLAFKEDLLREVSESNGSP